MNALDKSNLIKGAAMPAGYMALVAASKVETVTDADYAPLPHVARRPYKSPVGEYVTHSELELLFDYDYQPFEPADQEYPGANEAVTITGIYFREIDLLSEYTAREIEEFESQILEQHS